jgi:hypothetical protein
VCLKIKIEHIGGGLASKHFTFVKTLSN